MIICVCKAVSERHIRAAVRDGATNLRDLSRELGVGTCCGKCVPEARAVLSESRHACETSVLGFFPRASTEFAA